MASPQSEPSMDEILASIRRIISEEDDAPNNEARKRLQTLRLGEDEAVDLAAEDGDASDELVGKIDTATAEAVESALSDAAAEANAAAAKDIDPLDTFDAGEDAVEATPAPKAKAADPAVAQSAAAPAPATSAPAAEAAPKAEKADLEAGLTSSVRDLISAEASRAASDAFGSLQENVRVSASGGRTIEDIVEAMLEPLIKQWLDANLPRIVEEKVEEEVRRIARRR